MIIFVITDNELEQPCVYLFYLKEIQEIVCFVFNQVHML